MSSRICLAFCTPGSLAAVAAYCAVGQAEGVAAGGAGAGAWAAALNVIIKTSVKIEAMRMDGSDCNPSYSDDPPSKIFSIW